MFWLKGHFGYATTQRMVSIKFLAGQAKSISLYKNLRTKVMKCCGNIYFNRQWANFTLLNILSFFGWMIILVILQHNGDGSYQANSNVSPQQLLNFYNKPCWLAISWRRVILVPLQSLGFAYFFYMNQISSIPPVPTAQRGFQVLKKQEFLCHVW